MSTTNEQRREGATRLVPDDAPKRWGESWIYLAIATLLCFGIASPAILGEASDDLVATLVPAAQLTPFLAALLLFVVVRPGGFATQFALRWGKSWRAIGVGFAAVIVIGLVQLGLGVASGHEVSTTEAILAAVASVPVVLVMQSVFAIGEEFGWRGWLISRLRGVGFWALAAFSALAWMLWHLPAVPLIVGDAGAELGVAYVLAIGSWAPLMVALRLWSGSVWPAVIVHGALNSVRVFLTQSIASGDGVNWLVEALGWILWLLAAALVWRYALRRSS